MKKYFKTVAKIFTLAFALSSVLTLGACFDDPTDVDDPAPTTPSELGYDANGINSLYYQNAVANFGSAPILGDPYLYYEEEEGLFYLYGTTGGSRFDYYISSDLTEWELGGTCFEPTNEDWCHSRLWAPEMHKINGRYWLYYSAASDGSAPLHCSVAVADSPRGPFTNYIDEDNTPSQARFIFEFPTIDGSVFVDDDGSLYYYFAKDQVGGVSTIWGVELENPYTIKEGCEAVQLTRVGYADMTSGERREWEAVQGNWNEGPFMVKHDGKYYLTYSANSYTSKYYGVGYAVSNSPLSGFYKPEDSMLLGSEKLKDQSKEWDYVSGTGHHMFINIGSQSYVVYHKHYNIKDAGNVRTLCLDTYGFRKDGSMYINGSTVTPQPKPEVISGYKNIASDAKLSCTAIDADQRKLLTDGGIGVYFKNAEKTDVYFDSGKTTITITFDSPRQVKAIMFYCGSDYSSLLRGVEKIEFDDGSYITDIRLDGKYIDTRREYMAVGNAISATLYEEITVSKIKITINTEYIYSLSEIAVIGK